MLFMWHGLPVHVPSAKTPMPHPDVAFDRNALQFFAMVKTYGLTHIALAVKDAKRSFEFYHKVFGIIKIYDQGGWIQAQTPGSRDIIVFDESAPRIGKTSGIAHFGFRLVNPKDIDAAADTVKKAGGKILDKGEFCPGEPYLFFKDLNDYEVEIAFELPTPVDPKPAK
jgi:catechol 2,3-dioxygenase-like lactoylglutathione lyase family enzyme